LTKRASAERIMASFPVFPGPFDLQMPKGAKVLSLEMVVAAPLLWAVVDPSAELETRSFEVIASGRTFDPGRMTYIGTFTSGEESAHLFERITEASRG
jgi:hypothetical protein